MAVRYIIEAISYYELEYDQPQEEETLFQDFWSRYEAGDLGQGEINDIELIS